jgi:TonB family protein
VFSNPPLISQTGGKELVVKGKVVSMLSGNPLPGANILIKGTYIGTITDLEGNYKLTINGPDDILIITSVGYKNQFLPVGNNSTINVNLEPDIMAIEFNKDNKFDEEEPKIANEKDNSEKSNSSGFVFIEELPSYPGGTFALQKFLQDNLQYPAEAKAAEREGTVIVSYIIDINGKIKSPQILRGLSTEMDNEALRITKLINGWKPGKQGGRPVATTVTMPIEFKLK